MCEDAGRVERGADHEPLDSIAATEVDAYDHIVRTTDDTWTCMGE